MAMSVAVAAQWGMNYTVSQLFPVIMESEANQGVFWKPIHALFHFYRIHCFDLFAHLAICS